MWPKGIVNFYVRGINMKQRPIYPEVPTHVLRTLDVHLIYIEAALQAEGAEREMPEKLRKDLLREVKTARRMINGQ
jgi:hypothetical protein